MTAPSPTVLQRLRLLSQNFSVLLLLVVLLASLLPAQGTAEPLFKWLTRLAIALLFFLHGARLSRQAIIEGIMHWRLHVVVFALTFVLFPLLGWIAQPLLLPLLGGPLVIGILYLCALPATVQSAIAFTSIAGGNVPAAVCSASASSLLGIVLTPLILQLMLQADAQATDLLNAIVNISTQLLLPFILGHLTRPLIIEWLTRYLHKLRYIDQGSILLVVYTAFSNSVSSGLWHSVDSYALFLLAIVCLLLLGVVLLLSTLIARALSFGRADEITIVFCGSKKSLATGIPMAQVLFSATTIGPALLPIMIFHQIQLMACAWLAGRYARHSPSKRGTP